MRLSTFHRCHRTTSRHEHLDKPPWCELGFVTPAVPPEAQKWFDWFDWLGFLVALPNFEASGGSNLTRRDAASRNPEPRRGRVPGGLVHGPVHGPRAFGFAGLPPGRAVRGGRPGGAGGGGGHRGAPRPVGFGGGVLLWMDEIRNPFRST